MFRITRIASSIVSVSVCLTFACVRADEPSRAKPAEKANRPPRKVVVGTAVYGPYGKYPGVDERMKVLSGIVDEMAAQAKSKFPGRGLDLAILPETTATPVNGPASDRAFPLKGKIQDTFSALARKHQCYIVMGMDMLEEGPGGPLYSNVAVLFDRQGAVAGIYRKVHPVAVAGTSELESGITPGRDYPVFDCDFGKLGIQICWDIQFAEGWDALARAGAEIVVWPTASPATVLPTMRASAHRYYVVSSPWRDNATIYEPTGMVAERIQPPQRVLVRQLDLSFAIVGWSSFLHDGKALSDKFGDKVGYHYSPREDMGLFWSNDPSTPIGTMVRSIGAELLDDQVQRNRTIYAGKSAVH